MKTIHIHQMSTHSHSANLTSAKVYQGYSKVIRFVVALLALFCFNIGNVWGTDTQVGQFASDDVVTSTTYTSYSDDNWTLSKGGGGTNKSCGYNNTAGNKTTIGNAYGTSANTSHYGYTIVGITKISNANKMTFTYTGGNTYSNGILYLGYSTDGSSWDAVSLKSGSGLTGQGGAVGTANTTYTFEFSSTIASAYYAIIVSKNTTSSDGQFRFDHVTATFYYAAPSSYTVTVASNNDSYGTVSASSVASVAPNTSISASSNVLTVGSTTVTATAHAQDADYNYAFSSWSGIPAGGKVTADVTVTANFTRTARTFTNYRTECDDSAPSITTDPTSLSDMGYRYGSSPTAKSFSMSGENLTSGTLTVTAPTNYEVCKTSGGTYASSITFTGVSGTLSATTVYVRLKSGKSVGDYNDEKVSISGCGLAAAVKVNCSGTVYYEDIYKTGLHTSTYSTYASGVSKTGTYTVPSLADVSKSVECEGLHYHFVGWVTDTYKASPEGHIIEATGSKTADNTTYWAVWVQEAGEINYTKVTSTSAVVDGVYVIINNGKYLPNATTDSKTPPASGDTYAVTLSLDGNTISSSVTSGMKWYFTMSDGKATIMNAASAGSYLYEINDGNGIRVYTTSDTWTVEENSTGFALKGTNNSRYCAIYNNASWRSYATKDYANYEDGGIIYLYKETIEYEDPVTECPELTCGTPTTPTSTPSTYSATLGWTEASPGTKARYEYIAWPKGTDEPTSGYSTSETTSGSVSGLLSNTEYRWKVRKVCTGTDGESGWLKSSFTTTGATLTFSVLGDEDVVAGQSSTSALPSADVPTNCGNCWVFAGWTPAEYEGSSAPAKLYPNGSIVHLGASDGTTLYAVYSQTEFGVIWGTDELVNNGNYVLTYEIGDNIYALSNTDYSSYDAGITTVTSLAREDADNYYLYNVSVNNIWRFTGSASSGQLYNEVAEKYVNLSSTTAKLLNTTNNLTFTNDGAYWNIKSTNYLVSNSTTSYTVSASIGEDDYSAIIYRQTSSTYSTNPGCDEYSITWLQGGEEYDEGTPSTTATTCGGIETMPDDPEDDALACAEVFVGWSETELTGTGNGAPADLFTTSNNAPRIDENKTFHAVFASVDTDSKSDASLTSTFTSKSWEDDGSLWTSGGDGAALDAKGVQVTTAASGANATTNASYMEVTSIVITYGTSNSAAGSVAVEVGGTAMELSEGSISGGVSDQTLTYTPAAPATSITGAVKITVTTTNKSIYIKSVQINYSKYGYKDYVTYCSNEFTIAGNWSTTGSWSLGHVPTINERAIIKKAAVVDVATAKAKEVILNQSSGNTGSLEISAGKELTIAKTLRKTTDGTNYVATRVNDVVINSTSALGLGALVMGNHDGTNKATVNFYTRSKGDKHDNTSVGQYVGTPFSDETNILYNWYNSWVYKIIYNSGVMAWERVNEGQGMDPFKGYCVFSADAWDNGEGHSYWMQGTLVSSANHTCSGLNWKSGTGTANLNNENLLANSWMAPIKIKAMQTSDFTNAEATIYIFNSTSYSGYSSLGGNYDTYTVNVSEAVIPAMQSFSVFTKGSSASVTLDYNRIVYAPALAGTATPIANKAPQRAGASEDEADKMRLFVRAENGYGDMLYMWEREDFEEGFENGWDGRKLYGESYAPQLYAITPDGEMAVNCVPDWEGTVLGFKKGTEDNVYTFTFEYEGENTWYLNDMKEQTSTLISSESRYMFMASDEDMAARFIISRTPIHSTPTGIEQSAISGQKSAVRKIVIDDHVYIIRNGKMYSAEGVMVR